MNALCTTSFDFLKNKNVLLISEDKDLIKSANYNLFEDLNRLEQVNSFLNITNYSKFDLIIIDIDSNELSIVSSILSIHAKDIPVIFVTTEVETRILEFADNIKLRNIIIKDINSDLLKYYVAIILKKSTIINFNNGYYFDLDKKEFYCNDSKIKLTALERDLFIYLISNRSNIVSYEQIQNNIWKNKKFTIYGMRNIINKIREKSYYDIINNVSKSGYTIKNYHIFN